MKKRHLLKNTFFKKRIDRPEVGRTWCGRKIEVHKILAVEVGKGLCISCKRNYYKWRKDKRVKKLREKKS